MSCKCYHADHNFLGKIGVCWGTKECEACSCDGDEAKCNFYDYVRERAKKPTTNADYIHAMSDEKLARLVKIGGKGMNKCKECMFYSRPVNEWPCSSCKTIRIMEKEDHFTSPEQYYKTLGEEPTKGRWVRCVVANYNWCCSVCGCGFTDYRLNYCYDCGAKMEE